MVDRVAGLAGMLRHAGIKVGTGQVIDAVRALGHVELDRRDDVRECLHATLITRHEDRLVFDALFELLFRDAGALEQAMSRLLPELRVPTTPRAADRRAHEALAHSTRERTPSRRPVEEVHDVDVRMTVSGVEVDRTKDFEQMSATELEAARRAIARLGPLGVPIPTRRLRASSRGRRIDLRRTLRASVRSGASIDLVRSERRRRPPTLVVLCDVSGSMDRYSRILLFFVHTLAAMRGRLHAFTFGTRLTNITRALRHRDVDAALAAVGRQVRDWSGGTRIASSLHTFNREWSRRVLAPGAIVLMVTDGLERDEQADLAFEADRLRRSCRRLIWLNPLLRYREFEPRARGVIALLANVDEHRPVHNLESLQGLVGALAES